jgi:histidyl-tRNA synthetase
MARAYLEHAMDLNHLTGKLFTFGPMFRRERPQAGRLRQFHQLDVEAFGVASPSLDAEVLVMLNNLVQDMGIGSMVTLELNSLGCAQCRPSFRSALVGFLSEVSQDLCPDCQRRMNTNPLRVLDCKRDGCKDVVKDAPSIHESLCGECLGYHEALIELLEVSGVFFELNTLLVRGLDYYSRTVFELTTTRLGAQNAVAAGGRYDSLLREIGKKDIPGIGFAVGMERLVLLLQQREFEVQGGSPLLFVAPLDSGKARQVGFALAGYLRGKGVAVEVSHQRRSLKANLRKANRMGCRWVAVIGENELEKGTVLLRNMEKKEQTEVSWNGGAGVCSIIFEEDER